MSDLKKISSEEIDEPIKHSERLIKRIKRFSFGYFFIYCTILVPLSVDAPDASNCIYKLLNAYQSIGKLGLNGLGDALAGLFAPLAFFWLAAAVNVQSNQLRSQQLELRAQRYEMNETQTLMQEQISVTDAQNQILREQQVFDKQRQMDGIVNKKFELIRNAVTKRNLLSVIVKYKTKQDTNDEDAVFLDKGLQTEIFIIDNASLFDWFEMFERELFIVSNNLERISEYSISHVTCRVGSYTWIIEYLFEIKQELLKTTREYQVEHLNIISYELIGFLQEIELSLMRCEAKLN